MNTTPRIIGLDKAVEDPGSGAVAHFHVVRAYSVMLHGEPISSATFAGYVSRAAFDAGKTPLMHTTTQMNAAPAGDSAGFPHWFASTVLQAESEHAMRGAVPVFAAEPEASA